MEAFHQCVLIVEYKKKTVKIKLLIQKLTFNKDKYVLYLFIDIFLFYSKMLCCEFSIYKNY